MDLKRRTFIKQAVLASACFPVLPSVVMGGVMPDDTIKLGLIGCSSENIEKLKYFLSYPGVQCKAIYDADPDVMSKAASEIKVFNKEKPLLCSDYLDIISSTEINTVIDDTGNGLDGFPSVKACEKGKNVYSGLPGPDMSIALFEAWQTQNCIVQIDLIQRFNNKHQDMVNRIKSGYYGKIQSARIWVYGNRSNARVNYANLLNLVVSSVERSIPDSVLCNGIGHHSSGSVFNMPDMYMSVLEFGEINVIIDVSAGYTGLNYGTNAGAEFIFENGTVIAGINNWTYKEKRNYIKEKDNLLQNTEPDDNRRMHVEDFMICSRSGRLNRCNPSLLENIARIEKAQMNSLICGHKVNIL